MLDNHCFCIVEYFSIGPICNRWGFTFAVAEIGEVWAFRWETPQGTVRCKYFSDYMDVIKAINDIQQGCKGN